MVLVEHRLPFWDKADAGLNGNERKEVQGEGPGHV